MDAGRYENNYFYFGVILVGLLPWTFFLLQSIRNTWFSWRKRHSHQIEIFLLLWVITITVFFSFSNSKLIPYILPVFPPLAILIGRYFASCEIKHTIGLKLGWLLLPLLGIGIAVFCLQIPKHYPVANPDIARLTLLTLSLIFIFTTVIAPLLFFWKKNLRYAVGTLCFGTLIGLIYLLPGIPSIDHNSIKPLAIALQNTLKPTDKIVNYNRYNQDLPFYLKRKIIVVNWFANELSFGLEHQKNVDWMIHDNDFWKMWDSSQRIFVVTRLDDLDEILSNNPHFRYYPIAKTQRNIVFCNQKI